MASRKRRGLGESLNDILKRAQDAKIKFSEEGDQGGIIRTPGRRRDRGYDIFSPEEGPPAPRRAPRPGLGNLGLERIQEALAEFREEPLAPPEEPPTEEDTVDRSNLPKPEYIYPIKQSTKASFSTKRPDKYFEFYGAAASQQSTRVYAMQWIPTHRVGGDIVGDIFVAFARPSNGKSSLFVYKEKKISIWENLKAGGPEGSFGKTVRTLGSHGSYDSDLFSIYEKIHPDHETWIYDSLEWWDVIRPMNESVGTPRKRGALARTVADIVKELGL